MPLHRRRRFANSFSLWEKVAGDSRPDEGLHAGIRTKVILL
jgi:hypothetical protein